MYPQGVLKPVLHREQPNAEDRGDDHDRQLNRENAPKSYCQPQSSEQARQSQIRDVERATFMPPARCHIERDPIEQQKDRRRQDQMRYDWVTRQTIEPPSQSTEPNV